MAEPGASDAHAYATRHGTVSVTNPVQRLILAELAHRDLQLQDLVELTGKSKPALSGVYVKELLAQGLVVERPHPQDSRRKMFRLNASPVHAGRSEEADAPAPGEGRFSLAEVLAVLDAAGETAGDEVRSQARLLGRMVRPALPAGSAQEFATALGRFAEDEGLATHLQLDFEALRFRCLPGPRVAGQVPPERAGFLLAAVAEGMAEASGLSGARFAASADGEAFRLEAADDA